MLWNIYCLHKLSSFIVSDWDPEFVFTLWKSMCKQLKIKVNLFTAYHLKTDSQTEQVNQNVECDLWMYCNYMQDDWVKWLLMVKFSDNNNVFSVTSLSPFWNLFSQYFKLLKSSQWSFWGLWDLFSQYSLREKRSLSFEESFTDITCQCLIYQFLLVCLKWNTMKYSQMRRILSLLMIAQKHQPHRESYWTCQQRACRELDLTEVQQIISVRGHKLFC